jgi:hypothetical protein
MVHFSDVPYTHPAFREIETLFDHGACTIFGFGPQWPKEGRYDAAKHAGFRQKNNLGAFAPEQPVTRAELNRLIAHFVAGEGPWRAGAVAAPAAVAGSDGPLTRGEASVEVWKLIGQR